MTTGNAADDQGTTKDSAVNDQRSAILVVGIGSPHGDDQLGWLVAQELSARQLDRCCIRMARTPLQLLDWLAECEVLHVVDACRGPKPPGSIYQWQWPSREIEMESWSSTHDFNLPGVLGLAEQLGLLPTTVIVWGIEAGGASRTELTSALCVPQPVKTLADQIQEQIDAPMASSQK